MLELMLLVVLYVVVPDLEVVDDRFPAGTLMSAAE